jgi:hypothetical protein
MPHVIDSTVKRNTKEEGFFFLENFQVASVEGLGIS